MKKSIELDDIASKLVVLQIWSSKAKIYFVLGTALLSNWKFIEKSGNSTIWKAPTILILEQLRSSTKFPTNLNSTLISNASSIAKTLSKTSSSTLSINMTSISLMMTKHLFNSPKLNSMAIQRMTGVKMII